MIPPSNDFVTTDILKFRSLLDLSLEFVNGRETLRDLKQRQKKHLIGTFMPNVELIVAAGAIPTYPIRMKPFGDPSLLKAIDLGKTILGDSLLSGLIQTAAKFDANRSLEKLIRTLIDTIFKQWETAYNKGVDLGVPSDECYGIKVLTGMFAEKGKNLSGAFLASVRCSAFEKLYETIATTCQGIFIDVPPMKTPEARDVALQEVLKAKKTLESITGLSLTQANLRTVCEITNECKRYAWRLVELALNDKYPFNPVTFGEFLSLIEIGFHDYLGNPARFRDLLKNLVYEIELTIQKSDQAIDVSKFKKILFTSRYSGWDHIVEDYVYENHGRVIYADWFIYGLMDQIKTTGDMFENYADYLISNNMGFCPTNTELVDNTFRYIVDNKFDAVIYNQLFGCHSLSTGYTRLRQKLMKEEIPSTMVSFNNVGENREQLKTRVVALMELLK
jgi:benzoyl-CoA reductase/2-hydroxyglutaryl-CoA dehydratase subunit BcrC/BadD/HgdB